MIYCCEFKVNTYYFYIEYEEDDLQWRRGKSTISPDHAAWCAQEMGWHDSDSMKKWLGSFINFAPRKIVDILIEQSNVWKFKIYGWYFYIERVSAGKWIGAFADKSYANAHEKAQAQTPGNSIQLFEWLCNTGPVHTSRIDEDKNFVPEDLWCLLAEINKSG